MEKLYYSFKTPTPLAIAKLIAMFREVYFVDYADLKSSFINCSLSNSSIHIIRPTVVQAAGTFLFKNFHFECIVPFFSKRLTSLLESYNIEKSIQSLKIQKNRTAC